MAPVPVNKEEDDDDEMIPVHRSKYVNLEVHFKKQWKMFTCDRYWTKPEILSNLGKELSIPQREQD